MTLQIKLTLFLFLLLTLFSQVLHAQTFQRPFGANSIWNRTIPTTATYIPANLGVLGAIANDREWIYQTNVNNPFHYVYQPEGYQKPGINIPDSLIIPDEPNGSSSFLAQNGTFREYNALRRTTAGSDPIGYYSGTFNLYDSGIGGGHAGSGMSVIAGSIRQGELESGNAITHALKIELDWAKLYRNNSTSDNQNNTFRWPARNSDQNYAGYGGNTPNYTGTISALRMGSLCAIPRNVNLNSLGLSSNGLKIAQAMQNYGAYVVDTTADHWLWGNGGYTMSICAEENEATNYFTTDNGYYNSGQLYTDMAIIYPRLSVVDSNTDYNYAGVYRIVNKAHGTILNGMGDPYYSPYWGYNLDGWQNVSESPSSVFSNEQYWSIADAGNGYYRLSNWNHLTSLNGTGDTYYSPYWKANLSGWQNVADAPTGITGDEQLWKITSTGDGYVRLVNKSHGTALNGTGDTYYSSIAGTNLSGWQNVADSPNSSNSDEQKWQLQLMYSPN